MIRLKLIDLMLRFFEEAARETTNQIIVTTYLTPDQLERLQRAGVNAVELTGRRFLSPTSEKSP